MRKLVAPLLLSAAVLFAFAPALDNGFVYDDEPYVTENPNVRAGLTLAGVRWACSTAYAANWHPLTWLSHMLDFELFGAHPAGHHATSLILHLANTLLLFFCLERMTGARWKSAWVAALFGLHPLRVESVAWVAERKDLLSTLFWLLATIAYVRYARAARASTPWLATVLLALGLAAKPMLVTLPFTLLLLDGWPLDRWRSGAWRLLREKLPMLVLVAGSCAVTLWAQHAGRALIRLEDLALGVRVENAVVSTVRYLGKTLWPRDLAVFYPHPQGSLPVIAIVAAALLLIAITAAAFAARRSRPYLLFGWLWYLGTLVPVIGLVQVGSQALADRYTYVPLIGIFVIVVWGGADLLASPRPRVTSQRRRAVGLAASALLLLGLATATRAQVRVWRDPIALFEHALAVAGGSAHAHTSLADALDDVGRVEEASVHYREAIRLDPSFAQAHNNLGVVLYREGRRQEAIAEYTAALRQDRGFGEVHGNLARALAASGRSEEALRHFEEAVRLDPRDAQAHADLGDILFKTGAIDEAVRRYGEALRIRPEYPEALNNLGVARTRQGRLDDALDCFTRALALRPDYPMAHANRAAALYAKGEYAQARAEVERARKGGVEPPAQLIDLLERVPLR